MIFFSNKSRPYHFGPYPLERLQRDSTLASVELSLPPVARPSEQAADRKGFAATIEKYRQVFHALREDLPASEQAPVPNDLERRSVDIKGSAYFLNASQVGWHMTTP